MPVGHLGAPPTGCPTSFIGEEATGSLPEGQGPSPVQGSYPGQAADSMGSDSKSVDKQATPLSPT